VQALIERGADPKIRGQRGLTALMMAAAAARPNPAIVKYLIDKGADVQAHDEAGRTALDWALMQGETDVARLLRDAGAPAMLPPTPVPAPVTSPRPPRDAVEKAIARLQPIGPSFYERTKCISCHHQSLPAIAVKLASAKGAVVDRALAAHPTAAMMAVWSVFRDNFLLGRCSLPGFLPNVTYGLLGFAEEGIPASRVTDAVVLCLGTDQRSNGSWRIDDPRPPLTDNGSIVPTALAIRALSTYTPPGRRPETKVRIARARRFLLTASVADTQDEVFKLLRTQLEDGTWFVRSRAFGFQRYFDAGFPHGTDQFISAAATAWATIALAYTYEDRRHEIQDRMIRRCVAYE
jgi:hypothetical protein